MGVSLVLHLSILIVNNSAFNGNIRVDMFLRISCLIVGKKAKFSSHQHFMPRQTFTFKSDPRQSQQSTSNHALFTKFQRLRFPKSASLLSCRSDNRIVFDVHIYGWRGILNCFQEYPRYHHHQHFKQ